MNLKEVKHRILSVKNTQKITSAMKLVSSAKLRRVQSAVEHMRPYRSNFDAMLSTLISGSKDSRSQTLDTYTAVREEKRVVLIAVSSDTGLCGAFNANVVRLMNSVVQEYRAKGTDVTLLAVGSKMCDAAKKLGLQPDVRLLSQAGAVDYNTVAQVAAEILEQYRSGNVDKVEMVYTSFESMSRHTPIRKTFLPFVIDGDAGEDTTPCDDIILEPGREQLLASMLPKAITLSLYSSLLDSAVSEHAARMLAMQLATDNADELISNLTLEYNKARQQAITSEILDIVGGSEANR